MWLIWYDDNPKHSLAEKIAAARAVYAARFGTPATVVLLPDGADTAGVVAPGCEVRAGGALVVRPNMIYAGEA